MLSAGSKAAKLASVVIALLAIFSTGLAIAHQCHTTATHAQQAPADSMNLSAPHNQSGSASTKILEVCSGIFVFILLVFRKYILKKMAGTRAKLRAMPASNIPTTLAPPFFLRAPKLSQLGILRI